MKHLRVVVSFHEPVRLIIVMLVNVAESLLRFVPQLVPAFGDVQVDGR